ncbi:MAG: mandelate racemase/muconate lactonizing enzyme family protein [Thermoleophilia bacterium]|nr:mandelate racemase/muconate lactonizing enzyme family protein [Gaiellaceae bacterium]MDW8338465.1 mandelate racemase/muconate lactonizing enzyme family protein [Thermoleophilia bacterium]
MAVIADVEVIPLMTPEIDGEDCDGSTDTVVVRVTDEDGVSGVGESDAPPLAVKAYIEHPTLHVWSQNLRSVLIGRDPFELAALYDALYEATIYPGRRGLGIHALSAIDIALHDLVGKQLGRPVFQLLGGRRRDALVPYATIFPGLPQGRSLGEVRAEVEGKVERALELGFRAVKVALFHEGAADGDLVEALGGVRKLVGDGVAIAIDFGFRWRDWRDALRALERLAEHDISFAEAPLPHDDVEGHGALAARSPIRIGGGEFSATRFEFREWLEAGIDVLEPDISRCGGLTEIRRIADEAAARSRSVVPHGWKTGITAAAQRHFHAATPNCPMFELLAPELGRSTLRARLTYPEPAVRDGTMALPDAPGLGIELDEEVVERYRVDRQREVSSP